MNKKLLAAAVTAAIASPLAAQAGTLMTANTDLTLSGGVTGAYSYNSDTGRDKFIVDDALIDIASEAKTGGMGVDLGIGTLTGNSLAGASNLGVIGGNVDTNGDTAAAGTKVQYGYVTVKPSDALAVDAGLIATNVGYEVVPSYANGNILRGMVWNAQPTYYTGARATYTMGGMSMYAEANKGPGWAIGGSSSFGGVDVSASYYSVVNANTILDIIASSKMGGVDFAVNFDYLSKAKATKVAGTDDTAYGLALYATVPMSGNFSLPMRLEYVNDGTSNLYGLQYTNASSVLEKNSAVTFTVTPTYNFSSSTFVRAELAYVSTSKKDGTLVDDKGVATDSNIVVSAQGGVLF
ncbi:MAG: outer membrane beta-barrel protein [Gammaproteobacteria bacterium]|nr:outer membrane beta-barrel protein [Gammaproteobacteria bacterium]